MGLRWQAGLVAGGLAAIAAIAPLPESIARSQEVRAQTVEDREAEADRFLQQGIQQYQTSQFREALQAWERSLAIYREIGDRQGEAAALENLGIAYRLLGQYQHAIDCHQQSLTIHRAINDPRGVATSLGSLGIVHSSLGQYSQAIEFYRQQLEIAREIDDLQLEGNVLGNLGVTYRLLGQYQTSIQFHQQSLAIDRETENFRGASASLGNLGNAYLSLSRYRQAVDLYQQQLAIAREINDLHLEANALGNLGVVYRLLGQYQYAIDFFRQSLEIDRKIENPRGESASLGNIGNIYYLLGQYELSVDLHQQSLAIDREIGNPEGESSSLGNLGNIHTDLGQYGQAIEFYREQLEVAREINSLRSEANALGSLGHVYYLLGQHERSIEFCRQSLKIDRRIGNLQGEASTLNNLGGAYFDLDRLDDAEMVLQQSVDLLDGIRQDLGNHDANKVSILEVQLHTYRNLQRTLIATDRPEEALEIADRARARSLVELLAIDNPEPQTALSADDIRAAARNHRAAIVVYSDLGNVLLAWVVRPDGTIGFREIPLDDTAIAAASGQTRREATQTLMMPRSGIAGIAAPDAEASELGDWANAARSGLARSGVNPPATADPTAADPAPSGLDYRGALRRTYATLIAPLEDLLPTEPGARLIIVPDRELALVPFAGLRSETGEYLVDRFSLSLAPSVQTLVETQRRSAARPAGTAPLVVGNPAPMPANLDPLPGAETEAAAIARFQNADPLIGPAATETAVKARWETARWLHFATHGTFADTGRTLESWLAFAPGDRTDPDDDGRLTLEEIFNARLQAEMVVMSACDTGRGRVTGEGVIGLARAFLRAGVPSAIATLWKANDETTAFLMEVFYRELAAGQPKAEALRIAQQETRARYPHPAYWAGFVLVGEPD